MRTSIVNGVMPNQGIVNSFLPKSRHHEQHGAECENGDNKTKVVNGVKPNHGITDNTVPNVETRT
jgi:hypothetical protein